MNGRIDARGRINRRLAGALVCLLSMAAAEAASAAFEKQPIEISRQKLFDLGVADYNADGALDVFSSNHKYRGTLLAGDGAGAFTAALDPSGLSATASTPGVDDLFTEPEIATKGLYIWIDSKDLLHIKTVGLGTIPQIPGDRVSGSISYPGRDAFPRRTAGAEVNVTGNEGETGKLSFDAGPDSDIVVFARLMDLPIQIEIDPAFPRSRILLGSRLAHPPANKFEIHLGDRHGFAWADFNSDGEIDAYISNGGQKGRVERVGPLSADELYFNDGDATFRDGIRETQISKGFCRGRYVAPVDYDADGDLDVFVACEDRSPLLFTQRVPGRYGSRSHLLSVVRAEADIYRWLDISGDLRPELIAINRRKIAIYSARGEEGYARNSQIRSGAQGKIVNGITVGDPDGDGDADLFVASRGGNALLRNTGRRLVPQKPKRLGLPSGGSASANWVDYDNDGLLDLHLYPQGIYRQSESGRFTATGDLQAVKRALWAAANFADVDSDGRRDLISALKTQGRPGVNTELLRNTTPSGSWLQLDLVGAAGNPQAIGAQVRITSGGRSQTAWVGQSEGSRFSTGHYRLYFGLGKASQVEQVTVTWPDGRSADFGPLAADARYTLLEGVARPYQE